MAPSGTPHRIGFHSRWSIRTATDLKHDRYIGNGTTPWDADTMSWHTQDQSKHLVHRPLQCEHPPLELLHPSSRTPQRLARQRPQVAQRPRPLRTLRVMLESTRSLSRPDTTVANEISSHKWSQKDIGSLDATAAALSRRPSI